MYTPDPKFSPDKRVSDVVFVKAKSKHNVFAMYEDLCFRMWNDGGQQFYRSLADNRLSPMYTVERVVGKSRRKRWCICARQDGEKADKLYAVKVAGPFNSAKDALAAYDVFLRLKGA